MRQSNQANIIRKSAVTLMAATVLMWATGVAQAESLFKSGIEYRTAQPFTPRSLFAVPRPGNVGDMVTIIINERTSVTVQNNITMNKEQTINENSTSVINQWIDKIFGVDNVLPSANGLSNEHDIGLRAQEQKQYNYTDTITTQVVQVLPNGYLLVQGKKTIWANREQQDLLVSGIVNPYYLNRENQINSNLVGNLQVKITGHGFVTRQHGDGIIGKYFNLFNR